MTTYHTNNPIGSTDPRDLYDNAENLDKAVNSQTDLYWDDRFGVSRKTIHGMEADFSTSIKEMQDSFNQFLVSSGYVPLGEYAAGLVLSELNQIFSYSGELYRASAGLALPYTTTGDWATESGNFVSVGDAALRQQLANVSQSPGMGASMVGLTLPSGKPATVHSWVFGCSRSLAEWAAMDGVTDDTDAIQDAINWAANQTQNQVRHIFVPRGVCKITRPLVIPSYTSHLSITGSGSEGIGVSQFKFYHPGDSSVEYWIDSKIQNLTITGIRFSQVTSNGYPNSPPTTLLRCKKPSDKTADTDTAFLDNAVVQFSVAIEHWGRGLNASGNIFAEVGRGIVLEWPNEGDYVPTPGLPISLDSTGYRAFRINYNRFHSIGTIAVSNSGQNASKIHAIQIDGSMLDIGRRLFEGVLRDGQITNSVVTLTPVKVLVLMDGSKNFMVSGLTMAGSVDASRIPDFFIQMQGLISNGSFSNILMDTCSNDAIRADANSTLDGVTFSGIHASNVGGSDASRSVINLLGQDNKVDIYGLTYVGSSDLNSLVRAGGTSVVNVHGWSTVGNSSRLSNQPGVFDATADMRLHPGRNWFARMTSDSGASQLGSLAYDNAGTNGVTLVSSGSINLYPSEGSVRPFLDNEISLGAGSRRFSTVYAGSGAINTSDARLKTPVSPLGQKEIEVAKALVKEIGVYKFLDMVRAKGDSARLHFGLTVQKAISIFEENGLDAFKYGVICHDQWDEEWEEWEDEWEDCPAVLSDGVYGHDSDGREICISPGEVITPASRVLVRAAGRRLISAGGDVFSFRDNELIYLMMAGLSAILGEIEMRVSALESISAPINTDSQ